MAGILGLLLGRILNVEGRVATGVAFAAAGPMKAWTVLVHEAKQQSPASRLILPLPRGVLEVYWRSWGVVLVDAVVMVEAGRRSFGFAC